MITLPEKIQTTIENLKPQPHQPICAYLYDIQQLQSHIKTAISSLPSQYSMYYAMKANSDPYLLQSIAPLVHGFETASLGEIQKARAASSSAPVLFGGPGKTDEELVEALKLDITYFHIESLHELRRLNYLAGTLGQTASILLRANLRSLLPEATLKMAGQPTQFGIDELEMPDAIALSKELPYIELQGFHFHSLSNNLDAKLHLQLLQTYASYTRDWAREFDLQITTLNVGGGIGVNFLDLARQFDWETFTAGLATIFPPSWNILFECGRFLVSSCGYYAVEVLDIKQNHDQNFVLVAGGTHHFRLPSSWHYSHPFIVLPREEWRYPFPRHELLESPITVAGQLCSPKDVLASGCRVSRVRIGDILVFPYTGAYAWSISHHDFLSHPHPEMIYLE